MTSLPWWGDLILALAALLVALGTISRYVWPALRTIGTTVHSLRQLWEDYREVGGFLGIASVIRDLAVDLTHVRALAERADHELHPNKGLSLRDSVTRTEHGIATLAGQVAAVSERQETLRAADEATSADLRRFLETEWTETKEANAHLRASLTEVLGIGDEDEGRH